MIVRLLSEEAPLHRETVASVEGFDRRVGRLKVKEQVQLLTRDRATIYLTINPE